MSARGGRAPVFGPMSIPNLLSHVFSGGGVPKSLVPDPFQGGVPQSMVPFLSGGWYPSQDSPPPPKKRTIHGHNTLRSVRLLRFHAETFLYKRASLNSLNSVIETQLQLNFHSY